MARVLRSINKIPQEQVRALSKSLLVTLSGAKGLCAGSRILRFAQNDKRHDGNFEEALRADKGASHCLVLRGYIAESF